MYLYVQYTITQYLYILLVKYQYWGWVSLSLLSLLQYKISRSNEIRVESAVVDIIKCFQLDE